MASEKNDLYFRCEWKLWEVRAELQSYSALFCALEDDSIDGKALLGVGLALKRAARGLGRVIEAFPTLNRNARDGVVLPDEPLPD